jgi:signal transduction histidine kinase
MASEPSSPAQARCSTSAAPREAAPAPTGGGISREMEDEVFGLLGALLGMLEVLSLDVEDPLAPRQRRFLDEALRFGDRLRARVEAMVILLSDQRDQRFQRAAYPLRRLIDHAVRGAGWSATEKGVGLELPAGGGWEDALLQIDAARVDRSLRGLTDALVSGVGQGGRVAVAVELEGPELCVTLRGYPGEAAQAGALELSSLLVSAWEHVFALQGGSLRFDREAFTARVRLPRRESV